MTFLSQRSDALLKLLLVAFLAALLSFAGVGQGAQADSVGEEFEYGISGNVRLDGEPLAGVEISVSGSGYEASTVTGEDGKWYIGVPGAEGDT